MLRRLLLVLALGAPLMANAQQQPKPAPPKAGDEQPAVAVGGAREDLRDDSGTTIVGERESPIGLYITPWRNAFAEQDIDRPARLLQVEMTPIDRDVFARQVEYHKALTAAANAKLAPAAAPAKP
ncbi:hypothetical protein DFR24_0073 [Panacagrimonas perspica]|uniref:Uncharacterized protein n=2 Tax=Panacagrimonas perspica TaxID=381431 RepID=A0A4R7PAX1_9GAMM|nr:hypothetical protein DFR24_0073 [Panacagrimonas perspica]THD01545.1 hypothetical protein B1810_18675 [Panacagrimonas perspica]